MVKPFHVHSSSFTMVWERWLKASAVRKEKAFLLLEFANNHCGCAVGLQAILDAYKECWYRCHWESQPQWGVEVRVCIGRLPIDLLMLVGSKMGKARLSGSWGSFMHSSLSLFTILAVPGELHDESHAIVCTDCFYPSRRIQTDMKCRTVNF